MKIVYSVSVEDYINSNSFITDTIAPRYKKFLNLVRIMSSATNLCFFLIIALATRNLENQVVWKFFLTLGIFMACLEYALQPSASKKVQEKFLRDLHLGKHGVGGIGNFTMELMQSRLIIAGEHGDRSLSLSLITDVLHKEEYVYLRTGPTMYVLPRKKIVEGDLVSFISELESRIPPPPTLPLPAEAAAVITHKQGFWTGRRAVVACILSSMMAILFVYFIKNCGCKEFANHFRYALALLITMSSVFAVFFLDMSIGLFKKEKKLHREKSLK